MSNSRLLDIRNLKKYFKLKRNRVLHAVDDISFHINEGETLGLVGESGCGKSTVARTVTKVYEPDGGQILFDGTEITNLSERQFLPQRKKMQMIFQDPYSSLNGRMTVKEILCEPLEAHNYPKKAMDDLVYEYLEKVRLKKEHINRYPHEFSGGQRQRIGIARALILNPKLIICDEAISALDVSIQAQIVNLLKELQQSFHLSYLFIAHDLMMIKYISDRIGVMYLGKLVELCSSKEIYANPLHPYTELLLSAMPIPDPLLSKGREAHLSELEVPSPVNPSPGCRFYSRCQKKMAICKTVTPDLIEISAGHWGACHIYS